MNRLLQLDVLLSTAVLLLAGTTAVCSKSAGDSDYPPIAADLEPLRSAFNAERGHVRAIFLASPT